MPTFTFTHKTWSSVASLLIAAACLSSPLISVANTPEKQPMNVIYILTDDQRYDEMGFMNPVLDTPNMDQLAEKGVHFKNSFVTTALCSPSRASILTGQYMHSHGGGR